jgi:hypothetical protein
MILGLLERFPGYTLRSLLDEDIELARLIAIEQMGGSRDGE